MGNAVARHNNSLNTSISKQFNQFEIFFYNQFQKKKYLINQ